MRLLLSWLCPASIFVAIASSAATQNDPADHARRLAPNLVRIHADFSSCSSEPPIDGFGFVVGEDETELTIVAPSHLFSRPSTGIDGTPSVCNAAEGEFAFFTADTPARKVALSAAQHHLDNDIAFVRLPKPAGWWNAHPRIADAVAAREAVSYVGYKKRPIAPLDRGVVLDACDHELTTGCSLWIEKLVSAEGASGTPVFNERGEVVGFILNQAAGEDVRAIRADEVRKLAVQSGMSWTTYTQAEESKLGSQLNAAIETGNGGAARSLLLRRFNLAAAECVLGEAIFAGNVEIARILLDAYVAHKTFDINATCRGDRTPLFAAIAKGLPDIALRIIRAGADPNKGEFDDHWVKGHPLTLAIALKQSEVVKALLDAGADVKMITNSGSIAIPLHTLETIGPLHAAAYVGDRELIRDLIARGVNPNAHSSVAGGQLLVKGGSPLQAALLGRQFAVARYLFTEHKADPFNLDYSDALFEDDLSRARFSEADKSAVKQLLREFRVAYCKAAAATNYRDKPPLMGLCREYE